MVDYPTYDSEQDSNDSALLAQCSAKVVCCYGGGGRGVSVMHVQRCMPEHLEAASSASKLACQI